MEFKSGDKWHTKVHRKIMKRMLNYCKKKDWFKDELERRLTPKIKIEPTLEELKQKEIEKLKFKIKKYETKIKMYQNKLKKSIRSLNHKIKVDINKKLLNQPTI